MNEYTLIWQILTAFLATGASATLYAMGGRAVKQLRRFIAPGVILVALVGISVWLGSFAWILLAVYPDLVVAWSLGYGSDIKWIKIAKRCIVGAVILALSALLAFHYGLWWVFGIHAVLVGISVVLGVFSIMPAAVEEFLICIMHTFPLFWYLFNV